MAKPTLESKVSSDIFRRHHSPAVLAICWERAARLARATREQGVEIQIRLEVKALGEIKSNTVLFT